jgi:hypothetical protein
MVWRIVRRLLALFIQVFVWHPGVGLVGVVLAVGVLGFAVGGLNSSQLLQGRGTSQTTAPVDPAAAPAPALSVQAASTTAPAPAVDQYIKGMTTFDAKLMWDSLDPTAVQTMVSQGGSQTTLQQRLDDAKQNGAAYEDITFIGGYPLQNGQRYLFYVVTRRGFTGPGQLDQIFFVFTVGQNGKILKIE